MRGFHAHLVATGRADANPADLLPPTEARLAAAAGARPRRGRRRCSTGSRPRTPLEVRDRALFELAYSCGLRAEEIVSLDLDGIDFDSETARVTGKGQKTRLVPIGEPAQRGAAPLPGRRRATRSGPRARGAGALRQPPRAPALRLRRAPAAGQVGARGGGRRAGSRRTRCATRSRRICSRAGRTCARSRSCSGTRASRRRRSTRGSSRRGCARSTQSPTHAHEHGMRPTTGSLRTDGY